MANAVSTIAAQGSPDMLSASSTASSEAIRLLGEYFGKLPKDVILTILEYAVIEERNIRPFQVCNGSNKFIWGENPTAKYSTDIQGKEFSHYTPRPEWKLSVPGLMATCKTFYSILNESAAFYRLNKFNFDSSRRLLSYLSSITPARLKDLRDISCTIEMFPDYGYRAMWPCFRSACVLLSTCPELQDLTVSLDWFSSDPQSRYNVTALKLLEQALKVVRCRNLSFLPDDPSQTATQQIMMSEETMNEYKAMMRGPPARLKEEAFLDARSRSGVYIHGTGRLIGEAKPGMVSSRTRAGRAKQARFDSNCGIIKPEAKPKFGIEGQLIWEIACINDHRRVADLDTEDGGVELLVEWETCRKAGVTALRHETWEPLELILTNRNSHLHLWYYYNRSDLWGKLDGAKQMYDAALERLRSEEIDRSNGASPEGGLAIKNRVKDFAQGLKKHNKYLEKAAAAAEKAATKAQKTAQAGKTIAGKKRKRST